MLNTESDPIDPNADPPEGQSGTGGTNAAPDSPTTMTPPADPPEGQSGGGTT